MKTNATTLIKKFFVWSSGLDRLYSWSFLGFLLGAASLIYTFYPSSADLRFNIVSRTDLISVAEHLPELKIQYEGKDISESHHAISVFVIKLENKGNRIIRVDDFDPTSLPALSFDAANILQTEVMESSSDYLSKWRPEAIREIDDVDIWTGIEFPPKILEAGDFVTFKVIVLHPEGLTPKVVSQGKVAGDKEVQFSDAVVDSEKAKSRAATLGTTVGILAGLSVVIFLVPLVRYNNRSMRKLREEMEVEFELKTPPAEKPGPS